MKTITRAERLKLMDLARGAVTAKYKKADSKPARSALIMPDTWLSTGSLALDRIIAGSNPGGAPLLLKTSAGRFMHIAGDPSTSKSAMLDHMFKSAQDLGALCLCSETEDRDPHFAEAIGLDLDLLEIQKPSTISQVADWGLKWHAQIRAKNPTIPILWGWDSLDASRSSKTVDQGMSETRGWMMGGGKSEELAEALRRISDEAVKHYPTTVVLLNQVRDDPTVMFGSSKYTPGGAGPHFYAGLELVLAVSHLGTIRGPYRGAQLSAEARKRFGLPKDAKGDVIGRWIRARTNKNKVGGPMFAECNFFLDFRTGIHPGAGLLSRLLHEGVCKLDGTKVLQIKPDGSWVEFPSESAWGTWVLNNRDSLAIDLRDRKKK